MPRRRKAESCGHVRDVWYSPLEPHLLQELVPSRFTVETTQVESGFQLGEPRIPLPVRPLQPIEGLIGLLPGGVRHGDLKGLESLAGLLLEASADDALEIGGQIGAQALRGLAPRWMPDALLWMSAHRR